MQNRDKIKLLRLAKGLRQPELADRAGIRPEYVSYIESGIVDEWERKLLVALDYSPDLDPALERMAAA